MADEPVPQGHYEETYPSRISQLFEVSVFMLLIVPSMLLFYFTVKGAGMGFVLTALGTIFHDVALLGLIAFFAWKNHEPKQRFGWTNSGSEREVVLGVLLFFLMFFVGSLIEHILSAAGVSIPAKPLPSFLTARSPAGYTLAFVLVVVVAVTEETIFRGYLILRLTGITGSRLAGVLVSTLIFSLGHGYEGVTGVIAVGLIGLALCGVYLWRKSLIAPMVMHFLQDFTGIFIAPLLKQAQG